MDADLWAADRPAGARTIVYGHNGSGKSTLAEMLLSIAESNSHASVSWEDELGQSINLDAGTVVPPTPMAVFTKKWVELNLSAFLDGDRASAIVTLGRVAIDAKEEEARLADELDRLREESAKAAAESAKAEREATLLARDVQGRIVSELKEFDYNYFTKNRFTITKVEEDLRAFEGEAPDANAHAEALKRLGERHLDELPVLQAPTTAAGDKLSGLSALLGLTPTRVALAELAAAPAEQSWVEHGLELHTTRTRCLFCSSQIDDDRRKALALHFDESWLEIRAAARDLLTTVSEERQQVTSWRTRLPEPDRVDGSLRSEYERAIELLDQEIRDRAAVYDSLESVLRAKAEDPGVTPVAPSWAQLRRELPVASLVQAVQQHNDRSKRRTETKIQRQQVVLDHLVGSKSTAFRELVAKVRTCRSVHNTAEAAADTADRRLDELRQARFTTKEMADTLTADLARVYGKDHLSIVVTEDGKSYECRRGHGPGTNLSEGERTTLSLLYFLRSLEDEKSLSDQPSNRIVVVDDPSSSLDREAIFATHQWLLDRLKNFDQYVILTHDFSLLRLCLKSHKNAWGRSMGKIKDGNLAEARFPKVAFLELYADTTNGERRSRVSQLPKFMLKNTSEYGYLFSMVLAGIADPGEQDRLFLLPNAARRVLEVFASYKAPHRTDFLQQLELLVKAQPGEPYRDVYDFCNRYSHGEGSESTDVLDSRTVRHQLQRSIEFLRSVDEEHFERMCAATENTEFVLP